MPTISHLKNQFQTLEKYCDGSFGMSAIHIETAKEINFNADQLFLMCSTYKLPMAIYLLQKVERGELHLTDTYLVTEHDLRPGAVFTLNQLDYSIAQPMTLHNLLKLMLQESCNTSTDILLRHLGGPSVLMDFLRAYSLHPMRVDRYMLEILAASDGIKQLPPDHRCTLAHYKALEQAVTPSELIEAKKIFKADVRDTTTPTAMTTLLVKLFKHELINAQLTELLLKIMRGCKRGPLRLIGLLPPRTPVAHKTGTAAGYTCDVGIITLPHHAGHIAISTYIKNSTKDLANNERVLAEASRMAYDCFLFNL